METASDDCCPAPARPAEPAPPSRTGLTMAASAGSILSAFLASACCVGPLLLALLGLGGGALLVTLEPYRPYFVGVTFVLLGAGFYLTYRRPKLAVANASTQGPGTGAACDCPAPRTSRLGRIMLWVATALVVGFLAFPYVAPGLLG
ncbi:MAG: mercury transporter MerT [Deltaproteobacteria bacterium]|nr:mercury transporter MerT [Deltaproteobacteria bacterium]